MDANDANNGNTDDAMDVDVEPLNAAQPSKNEVASTSAQHPAPQQEELPNFWIEMPPKPANWKEYHRLTIPNPPISLDLSNYQDPDDDGAELLCLVGEHDFRTEGVWYYAEMDDESFRKVVWAFVAPLQAIFLIAVHYSSR